MLKTLKWTWPLLTLAILVLVPWGCYVSEPEVRRNIVILDKTVPFRTRVEHRSLIWLINHLKIRTVAGEKYHGDRDYLGAYPGPEPGDPPAGIRNLTAVDALGADLVYVADTYGVYQGDLDSGSEMKAALERSMPEGKLPIVIQSDAASPVQSLVTAMDVVGQLGLPQVSIATTRPIE